MIAAVAVMVSAGFTACGKKSSASEDPKAAKDYVFKYEDIAFDLGNSGEEQTYYDILSIGTDGNKVVATASTYDYATGENICYLIDIDTASKTTSKKNLELPKVNHDDIEYDPETDSVYDNCYLGNMQIIDGTLIGTCDNSFSVSNENDYYSKELMIVCGWSMDGQIIWSTDLNEALKADYAHVQDLCSDGTNLYAVVNGNYQGGANLNDVVVFDKTGNILKVLELDTNLSYSKIIGVGNGKILAFYYDNEDYNNKAAYMDPATGKIGESVVIPDTVLANGYSCMTAGFDTDVIFSNNQGIYKFNVGDTEAVKIMDPINSDLNGYNVSRFVFTDKDHFIGSYSNIDTYNTSIASFSYVDPSTIPDKKVISIAVYYLDSTVRKRVVDFNKTSENYRITIKDYSQYATPDDYQAGLTKLNNDILAGDVPTVLYFAPYNNIDYSSFAKKGLLVEIDDLIKKDEELSGYKYLDNVFEAYAINGKHYMLVPSFSYQTFMTSTDRAAGRSSLTIQEFIDICKNAGPESKPLEYVTQSGMLNTFMSFDGKEFIDPTTGKCDLASEDFANMIDYIATLPQEQTYDEDYTDYYDLYRSGKILFSNIYLYDLNSYQYQRYNLYDGKSTLIGFATREGQPGIIASSGATFTLTNSANLDGAWEFVRYYLTPEYQNSINYDIPVLESAFDAWSVKGMEKPFWEDENGIKNYYDNYYYVDGVENIVPTMTQEDVDYIKNIIKSCTKSSYQNEQILSIIEEEASACFAKQKSAEDVCNIIQSRVQLYINENN